MTFEYPFAFLIIFIYIFCLKFCKAKKQSIYFSNTKMLKSAIGIKNILLEIVKFLAIVAFAASLASPIKKDELQSSNNTEGYEMVLALDSSESMLIDSRFRITKDILSEFIDKRKNDKIALTIYASFSYIAIPLTYDKDSVKRLLDLIEVGVAGKQTAIYEALFMSANLFKDSKTKDKVIILPTDGQNNIDTIPADVAIKTAQKYNAKVYTIGIGDSRYLDEAILKDIAKQTGGAYYQVNNTNELKSVYDDIDKLEKSKIESEKYIKTSYYYQISAILGLLLLTICFLLSNKRRGNV